VGFYCSQSAHELEKDIEEKTVVVGMDERKLKITSSCNNQQD